MIQTSTAYQAAITGDSRRMLLRAIIDIVDPDIVYGEVPSSGEAAFSQSGQLHDKVMDLTPYATLERRRWVLDGTFRLIPEAGAAVGQMGFVGRALSGEDGTFSPAFYVEEQFEGVSILQACSVFFSASDYDGVAEDFIVEVKQGGTTYYTKTFTGNAERSVSLSGFTVYNPDAIRVTVTKWSKPGRRARISRDPARRVRDLGRRHGGLLLPAAPGQRGLYGSPLRHLHPDHGQPGPAVRATQQGRRVPVH